MQRTLPAAAGDLRLSAAGRGQGGLSGNGDEGIERGVEGLDAGETRLRQLNRRDPLLPQEPRCLGQAQCGRTSIRDRLGSTPGGVCTDRNLRHDAACGSGQHAFQKCPASHVLNSHSSAQVATLRQPA